MWASLLFNAVLFVALVPGMLVSLPPGSGFHTQVVVHSLVFALVHHFLGGQLKKFL